MTKKIMIGLDIFSEIGAERKILESYDCVRYNITNSDHRRSRYILSLLCCCSRRLIKAAYNALRKPFGSHYAIAKLSLKWMRN